MALAVGLSVLFRQRHVAPAQEQHERLIAKREARRAALDPDGAAPPPPGIIEGVCGDLLVSNPLTRQIWLSLALTLLLPPLLLLAGAGADRALAWTLVVAAWVWGAQAVYVLLVLLLVGGAPAPGGARLGPEWTPARDRTASASSDARCPGVPTASSSTGRASTSRFGSAGPGSSCRCAARATSSASTCGERRNRRRNRRRNPHRPQRSCRRRSPDGRAS